MIKPFLIGLAGPARSGKNTVAEMINDTLIAEHGQRRLAMQVAFADPIKNMMTPVFTPSPTSTPATKKPPFPASVNHCGSYTRPSAPNGAGK